MSTETIQQPTSPVVSLFQKAHGRMVTLQRIDEQVTALLEQRRKIQEELRAIQSLINEEFDRITREGGGGANRALSHIADHARESGNGPMGPRVEISEVLS